jgi:hypothetical protein
MEKNTEKKAGRKAYESPRLRVYGDLRRLTLGGGGSKSDAGKTAFSTKR